jgi:hypothetical protein
METHDLGTYDPNLLPADLVIDRYHPEGDAYMQNLRSVQQAVVAASGRLTPAQVRAAKLRHTGDDYTSIAKKIGKAPATVSKWLKHPDAVRLLTLLRHYASTLGGARVEQRKHMLWRIAVDAETDDPRTAIQALAEINRMDMNTHAIESGTAGSTTVNVVINQDQLPRTTLDG